MSSRTLAFDLGGARVWLGTDPATNRNEIHIDEVPGRAEDAIGVRFGTYSRRADDNKGRPSPVKLSIDELVPETESGVPAVGGVQASEPRRSERLMFEFGQDDDPAAKPGDYRMDIFGQEDPIGQETDKGERRWLTLSKAKGLESYLPIRPYAGVVGVASGSVRVDRFYSDDGYFCYNFQGPTSGQPKGKMIKYRIKDDAGADLSEALVGQPGGWIAEAELVEQAL